MQEERIEKFRTAGKITRGIKKELSDIVQPGKSCLEVVEKIENKMKEEESEPAFPVNVCTGRTAAHDTPEEGKRQISEDKIVKIDFGACIDGYPSDHAVSFYFGEENEKQRLIKVAEEALERGINQIQAGKPLSGVGEVVESYVEQQDLKVIENLTGHLLNEYNVHGEKEIPVTKGAKKKKAEEGEVYGVEVFVTDGRGRARASEDVKIYRLASDLPDIIRLRLNDARQVLYYLRENREELPFTPRWLYPELGKDTTRIGVSILERSGVLVTYPILREKQGASVAQAEETVLVKEEGAEILT